MITIKTIIRLHELSIINFGVSHGIRGRGLMESAIAGPFQTFGGGYLYFTAIGMAAALGESLVINHPFIDRNKRTGILCIIALLFGFEFKLTADQESTYNFTI